MLHIVFGRQQTNTVPQLRGVCLTPPSSCADPICTQNLQTAAEVERIVREGGAEPATIAIIKGVPKVGEQGSHRLCCLSRHHNCLLHGGKV